MKTKTIPQLTEVAAELMQLLVRLKAANWNGYVTCCTCGVLRHYKDRMQGGHFISRHWVATRLLEKNIFPQCNNCNGAHRGMSIAFTLFMIEKYSIEFVKELLELKGQTKKYKRPEINKLIKELKGRIKVEEARLDTNPINDTPYDNEPWQFDVTLPWPPAIGDCHTHSPKGKTKVITRDSDKLMRFVRRVNDACQFKDMCTLGNKELRGRKFNVTIFAWPSVGQNITGLGSAVFDALRMSGVYKNDSQIESVRVVYKHDLVIGKLKFVIKTIEEEQ